MTIKELHNDLLEAYSVDNLNSISLVLINMFREKNFSGLQRISELIRDHADIKISNNGKGFATLMMLYHPDRAVYHVTQINKMAAENNLDGLMRYSHILKLDRLGEIASTDFDDIDFTPVYDWDMSEFYEEGYRIFDIEESEEKITAEYLREKGCSFYDALKIKEFGDAEANYPMYYLEEIEDFQMSSYGINDLDGIQLCTGARTIDLSNNKITDLMPLTDLDGLEELDLSDNKIGLLDSISNLKKLRSIFLSNNLIEDISPLYDLNNLEYVNLTGNDNIDPEQISYLGSMGITVDF